MPYKLQNNHKSNTEGRVGRNPEEQPADEATGSTACTSCPQLLTARSTQIPCDQHPQHTPPRRAHDCPPLAILTPPMGYDSCPILLIGGDTTNSKEPPPANVLGSGPEAAMSWESKTGMHTWPKKKKYVAETSNEGDGNDNDDDDRATAAEEEDRE